MNETPLPATVTRPNLVLVRPVARPSEIIELHKEVAILIRDALEDGKDYGSFPGSDKPALLKPGAERLAIAFGARPVYRAIESEADHDRVVHYTKRRKVWLNRHRGDREFTWEEIEGQSLGLYRYVYEATLVRQDDATYVFGTGHGVCSTMETKYIDRPRDCENTVLKMAQKRAFVGAVLNAFGLSARFTQDVDEMEPERTVRSEDRPVTVRTEGLPVVAAAAAKEPGVYEGTAAQFKIVEEILRNKHPELPRTAWGDVHKALHGRRSTDLEEVIRLVAAAAVDQPPPAAGA